MGVDYQKIITWELLYMGVDSQIITMWDLLIIGVYKSINNYMGVEKYGSW